jgi:hypothetical protein
MRIGALLGIAAGLVACAESPSPVAPRPLENGAAVSAEVSETQQTLPFKRNLWISCANGGAGEMVSLAGELEIRTHETVDDQGGTHLWTHVRPSGVVGLGAATGLFYRGTGGTFEGEAYNSDDDPRVYTLVNNFRIIGQGPGNNLLIHIVMHQTWNADGELVADVDLSSNTCR